MSGSDNTSTSSRNASSAQSQHSAQAGVSTIKPNVVEYPFDACLDDLLLRAALYANLHISQLRGSSNNIDSAVARFMFLIRRERVRKKLQRPTNDQFTNRFHRLIDVRRFGMPLSAFRRLRKQHDGSKLVDILIQQQDDYARLTNMDDVRASLRHRDDDATESDSETRRTNSSSTERSESESGGGSDEGILIGTDDTDSHRSGSTVSEKITCGARVPSYEAVSEALGDLVIDELKITGHFEDENEDVPVQMCMTKPERSSKHEKASWECVRSRDAVGLSIEEKKLKWDMERETIRAKERRLLLGIMMDVSKSLATLRGMI